MELAYNDEEIRSAVFLVRADPIICGHSTEARNLAEALARASRTPVAVLLARAQADQDEIVALVDRRHAVAVVIDLDAGPVKGEESLRRLFMAARCPIVVLGAARAAAAMTATARGAPP